jgi:hypothetical protein
MTDENVHHMWSEAELDQALATLNADVPPGAPALSIIRAELMLAATAAEPAETGKPKRHWGRWVAAGVTVAALVATALVVQTVGDKPVSSAAAQVLNSAADKIGASDPVVKPGQYLYIESDSWNTSTIALPEKSLTYLRETLAQQWVPADRTQEWLLRSAGTGVRKWIVGSEADLAALGNPEDEGREPEVRAKCGDYYLNPGEQPCQRPGSWQQPTAEFLNSLPTDPKQLYDRLRKDTEGRGQDPDLEMVVYVADAIRTGLVPAKVRANLYRALALVPALEISEQNANLAGRTGIALGVNRAGTKQEMIIDSATGQFIGERQTATAAFGDVPAGTVTGFSSVNVDVSDKIGDKPAR